MCSGALSAPERDGVTINLTRTLTPTELFGLFGLPAPRRLAAGDDSQPVDRARRVLEGTGWAVRKRPSDSTSLIALKASRVDELGRSTELWLSLAGGDVPVSPAALASRLEGPARGVLVATGVVLDGVRAEAERLGIELWNLGAVLPEPPGLSPG